VRGLITPMAGNPLSTALLDAIKLARTRADDIRRLRETLSVAIEMIAQLNHRLDAARRTNEHLRAQLRAERQAIEREDAAA